MAEPTALAPASPASVPERPPVLGSLLAILAGPLAATVVSVAALAAATALSPEGVGDDFRERSRAWLEVHVERLDGILVLLLPGQAAMLVIAFLAAAGARGGVLRRLGLTGRRTPAPTLVFAALGTLGVQWAVSIGFELTGVEPNEHLTQIWRMIAAPTGFHAAVVAVLVSVVPGVTEELLFRGVGQRRFLQRWPPWIAIGVASAIFAASHMDPQHAIAVFPIGAWLGFVAWRTGSVWASAACHVANNLSAFAFGRLWGDPRSGTLPATAPLLAAAAGLCLCAVLAARRLVRTSPDPG